MQEIKNVKEHVAITLEQQQLIDMLQKDNEVLRQQCGILERDFHELRTHLSEELRFIKNQILLISSNNAQSSNPNSNVNSTPNSNANSAVNSSSNTQNEDILNELTRRLSRGLLRKSDSHGDRSDRGERSARGERSERSEHSGRSDRVDRSERVGSDCAAEGGSIKRKESRRRGRGNSNRAGNSTSHGHGSHMSGRSKSRGRGRRSSSNRSKDDSDYLDREYASSAPQRSVEWRSVFVNTGDDESSHSCEGGGSHEQESKSVGSYEDEAPRAYLRRRHTSNSGHSGHSGHSSYSGPLKLNDSGPRRQLPDKPQHSKSLPRIHPVNIPPPSGPIGVNLPPPSGPIGVNIPEGNGNRVSSDLISSAPASIHSSGQNSLATSPRIKAGAAMFQGMNFVSPDISPRTSYHHAMAGKSAVSSKIASARSKEAVRSSTIVHGEPIEFLAHHFRNTQMHESAPFDINGKPKSSQTASTGITPTAIHAKAMPPTARPEEPLQSATNTDRKRETDAETPYQSMPTFWDNSMVKDAFEVSDSEDLHGTENVEKGEQRHWFELP